MRFGALVLLLCAFQAHSFPIAGKPVRIVVPFPPGGQTDIQARAIAQKMSDAGLSVIVENKPGASTMIGAREVQKAAPDGHTLLYTIAIHLQLPHLYRAPPWDAFRDFTPVTTGARSATVLTAHVSTPFNTVQELVATAAETRKAALPDLPTMREAGYDVGRWGYLWFWGPGGMTPATLEAVYRHLAQAIEHPDVKDLFAKGGSEAAALPPAEMQRVAKDLHERWGAVIRTLGVTLDQ